MFLGHFGHLGWLPIVWGISDFKGSLDSLLADRDHSGCSWWVRVVLCFCSDWVVGLSFSGLCQFSLDKSWVAVTETLSVWVTYRLLWLLNLYQSSIVSLWSQGPRLTGTSEFSGTLFIIFLWLWWLAVGLSLQASLWVTISAGLVIWGISGLCVYNSGFSLVVGVWPGLAARLYRGAVCVTVSASALSGALFSLDIVELGLVSSGICLSQYSGLDLCLLISFMSVNIHSAFLFFICSSS